MKTQYKIAFGALAVLLMSTHSHATCKDNITPTTPDSRFNLNADGTAMDKQTGLVWMRCSLGQSWNGSGCSGSASSYRWSNALSTAEDSSFADFDDWRLPNIKELASIVEQACYNPAINTNIFPATPSTYFWSGSPYASDSNGAWGVSFLSGIGNINYKNNDIVNVRLVRGGQ